MESSVRMGRHGTGKVRQGWTYRVLRTDRRVKVRIGSRKVMDTKQGSWKRKWDKGEQGLEFWYSVAQSVTWLLNDPDVEQALINHKIATEPRHYAEAMMQVDALTWIEAMK